MSAFYVGQQVKKVRGRSSIGVVGTIIDIGAGFHGGDILVRAEQPIVATHVTSRDERILPAGSARWTDSALWEPVIPPGLESIEDINALYEPGEVTA